MTEIATFQKEMEAKLKEWKSIITELRAEGEKMLETDFGGLINLADKGQMILNKYIEARKELEKLSKADDATWEKYQGNIQKIMADLDYIWTRYFKSPL
jgi:Zn-dependent alcohol dehydrogenase